MRHKILVGLVILMIGILFHTITIATRAEEYETKMYMDEPSTETIEGTSLEVRGWVMTTAEDIKIQVKIDDTVIQELTRNEARPDVLNAIQGYGGETLNPMPGFKGTIDISNVTDGNHKLIFQVIDNVTEEIIDAKEKNIEIKKYETKMYMDEPNTETIEGTSLEVRGWVMTTAEDIKIQVKIDDTVIQELTRNEARPDVLNAIQGYGGETLNPIPGFKGTIDISNVTDGNHKLIFQVIDNATKEIIDAKEKNIEIKKYETKMYMDEPNTETIEGTSLEVRGWVMTTVKDVKIQVKIDDTVIQELTRNEARPDVLNAIQGYGGETLNPIPGFKGTIDISNVTDGNHKLTFQVIDNVTEEIIDAKKKNIEIKKYEIKMDIDEPSTETIEGTSLEVRGWVMTTAEDIKIQVKIDDTVIQELTRNEARPDVLNAIQGYGGEALNPIPGFKETINISNVTDGNHKLIFEVINQKTKEVIQTKEKTIQIKKYDGMLYLDVPVTSMFNDTITIEGWEMSQLDGSYIKIYIGEREVTSQIKRIERPDVIDQIKDYGDITVNPTPGFTTEIDISSFKEGKQSLRIDLYTRLDEKIASYSKDIFIYHDIYYGIDVSKWNGNIDWSNVKKQGIDFVIVRVGYGVQYLPETQKDQQFEDNYTGAKATGLSLGAYYYSYATSVEEAIAEANNCLKYMAGKSFEYPIFYDLEDNSQLGLDKQTITDMAKAFCEIIHNAGYKTGVYANKNWLTNKIDTSQLPEYCDIWLAHYTSSTDPIGNPSDYKGDYQMWQYTSTGSVSGVSGNVDMNLCYKKY